MGVYCTEEVEDYDDHDMEGEYLGLRQRLKDSIRRKSKQSTAGISSQAKEKRLPYNNFGSFFGPSQPVISQRVIQESKSLLKNQELISKMLSTDQSLRMKVEKLKVARDYSFLSDDAKVPVPAKEPPPRNVSDLTSEVQLAQMLPKSKQPLGSNNNSSINVQGIRKERKSVPSNGQMQSKVSSYKSSSASKSNVMSMDSKKQLIVNNGVGPSSKPQVNKPIKQVSSHSHTTSNVQRSKKKQLSELEKARSIIRMMFHTDRFPVCDDGDISVANFEDCMREERRSARIGKKEDEEQLKLMQEEDRGDRMKRLAKRRKLSRPTGIGTGIEIG